ncbi:MAG: glycerate kinase [Hyphomicrobiaceae bacterium]|nr:glycerate kinase [Hyphomicrobiaceae bacterium]
MSHRAGLQVTASDRQGSAADQRSSLLEMFEAAVARAHPARCLPQHLPEPPDGGRIVVLGAGKAAAAMAVATEQLYRQRGEADRISGFVVTRHGYGLATELIEVVEAGHPVPDAGSVAAAWRALDMARGAGPNDVVLVLLSGGASALWSAPVDGVRFEAKQALTRQLLKSGARIHELNCVRKHLSRIKGGKLAAAAWPARLLTLAISDVPGDDPATIGSGPTVGDPTTLADARAVLGRFGIDPPPEIGAALSDPANETLKPGSAALASAEYELIAAPGASLEAAADVARAKGYRVEILGEALEGEARDVALEHAALARKALAGGERVAILSGGELTVTVRGSGAGGPNQEYALGLVAGLTGTPGIAALAADTDGADGGAGSADDPAGALVLPDTWARAAARDLKAANFLANNDSTTFFQELGDLVHCGPTQTNVNDFRAILIDP